VKRFNKRDYLGMVFSLMVLAVGLWGLVFIGIKDPFGWVCIAWAVSRIISGFLFPYGEEDGSDNS
jgi:hypothetical protein